MKASLRSSNDIAQKVGESDVEREITFVQRNSNPNKAPPLKRCLDVREKHPIYNMRFSRNPIRHKSQTLTHYKQKNNTTKLEVKKC